MHLLPFSLLLLYWCSEDFAALFLLNLADILDAACHFLNEQGCATFGACRKYLN
jgi:hypothetical protein